MAILGTDFSFEKIDKIFKSAKKIFFIGIGGVSMSSLARFSYLSGKEIFGYDKERGKGAIRLEGFAKIKYYSTPDSVEGMDLVVYSSAISEENFEYQRAKKLKIPTLGRANFLDYLSRLSKSQIAVSGTHGKSTTTSYLAKIFDYAEKNPTVFCGATMRGYESELLWGRGEVSIYEACEYMDSFLAFFPEIGVILNCEYDHPDYFKSQEEVEASFHRFAENSKRVVAFKDDVGVQNALLGIDKSKITYFSLCDKESDYLIKGGGGIIEVYSGGKLVLRAEGEFFGRHQIIDGGASAVCALVAGVSPLVISYALKESQGVKRRLEFIKKLDTSLPVFEDYAHHPTEIKATLDTLFARGYKRIFCVFQPHTFSRTHFLYTSFVNALSCASELYILPTYSAREENVYGVSEKKLASDAGGEFLPTFLAVREKMRKTDCDCAVIMGAGDITRFKSLI